MRLYQPAWNKLKSKPDEPLIIAANPRLHRRIYKAIIKEKNIDTVFHLLLSEQNLTSKLSRVSDNNTLIISLHIIPTLEGLF